MVQILDFNRLKEVYQNYSCANKNIGFYYIPKHTGSKYHKPVFTGFDEIKIADSMVTDNGEIIYNVKKRVPKYLDPYIENNVTREDDLIPLRCNNWKCVICRSYKKDKLFTDVLREYFINNLNKHFEVTFPGKPIRDKTSFTKSYEIMSNEWNKLVHRINYSIDRLRNNKELHYRNSFLIEGEKLPMDYDFSYIAFPRAQTNPTENNPIGFCHYHTLINLPININWINEIISKNKYYMGYNWISDNQEALDYLFNDFKKDNEWYIPFGIKHYKSSRNLVVSRSLKERIPGSMVFGYNNNINFEENIKLIDKALQNKGIIMPFDFYVKWFNEVKPKFIKNDYGELKYFNNYTKKHNDFKYHKR